LAFSENDFDEFGIEINYIEIIMRARVCVCVCVCVCKHFIFTSIYYFSGKQLYFYAHYSTFDNWRITQSFEESNHISVNV